VARHFLLLKEIDMPADRIVVLVVDDEILVRLAMAEELEDAGFDVVGAMDGTQAIAVLERRSF
jgi:CheY-like chemotaxis protein